MDAVDAAGEDSIAPAARFTLDLKAAGETTRFALCGSGEMANTLALGQQFWSFALPRTEAHGLS
jgi:hypothetical protein